MYDYKYIKNIIKNRNNKINRFSIKIVSNYPLSINKK